MTHISSARPASDAADPLRARPRPGAFSLDRWEVLQLVKDTRRQTGVGEREIAVLTAHLSVLAPGPVRSDQLLISYAQVGRILNRANCMEERRFRRGETRLEELGLIRRRFSGNLRRYPVRDAQGVVVDAYGIDLRPLFLQVETLRAAAAKAEQDRCRRAALRSRISAALSAVRRRLADALPRRFADLAAEIRNLLRRAGTTDAELLAAEARLALWTDAPEGCDLPDRCAADGGQIDRHSESQTKEDNRKRPVDQAMAEPDVTEIAALWQSCRQLSAVYPSPPRTSRGFLGHIFEFSGFIGLREVTLRRALAALGWHEAVKTLDRIAERIAVIDNPNGYLDAISRKADDSRRYDRGHIPGRMTGAGAVTP